jgi:hypothetical protein
MSKRKISIDDANLEEKLQSSKRKVPSTYNQYAGVVRQFCEFVDLDKEEAN